METHTRAAYLPLTADELAIRLAGIQIRQDERARRFGFTQPANETPIPSLMRADETSGRQPSDVKTTEQDDQLADDQVTEDLDAFEEYYAGQSSSSVSFESVADVNYSAVDAVQRAHDVGEGMAEEDEDTWPEMDSDAGDDGDEEPSLISSKLHGLLAKALAALLYFENAFSAKKLAPASPYALIGISVTTCRRY